MTVRVEARNASEDKEYVNAVACADKKEAEEVASEWRGRYGHVAVVTSKSKGGNK